MASSAAIGLRLHSGWAASVLLAESESRTGPRLIARRRIMLCELPHSKQPYHAAENMSLGEAEAFIAKCRAATIGLGGKALKALRREADGCAFLGLGLVASSARKLPALPDILNSHALIHAAEGTFYREALIAAAAEIDIKTRAIKNNAAADFLGQHAHHLREVLERIGKTAGPPWTMDEKCACLAALTLLPGLQKKFHLETLSEFGA